jgi:hypothetical protein
MSRHVCSECWCTIENGECGCVNEVQPRIPKTYDEYMASGLFSKEWEAGFIAGKTHELERSIKERMEK